MNHRVIIHSMVDEYWVAHNQFLDRIWQINSKIVMGGKSITMAKQKSWEMEPDTKALLDMKEFI